MQACLATSPTDMSIGTTNCIDAQCQAMATVAVEHIKSKPLPERLSWNFHCKEEAQVMISQLFPLQ